MSPNESYRHYGFFKNIFLKYFYNWFQVVCSKTKNINLMKKASTSSVSGGTGDGSRPRTLVGLGGQGSSEVIDFEECLSWKLNLIWDKKILAVVLLTVKIESWRFFYRLTHHQSLDCRLIRVMKTDWWWCPNFITKARGVVCQEFTPVKQALEHRMMLFRCWPHL